MAALAAEKYVFDDPVSALMRLRQFGELLAQESAATAGLYTDSTDSQLEHTKTIPEFKPNKREFTLDDGTPCVMVWTPQTNFPKAGSSGVSCNWEYVKE